MIDHLTEVFQILGAASWKRVHEGDSGGCSFWEVDFENEGGRLVVYYLYVGESATLPMVERGHLIWVSTSDTAGYRILFHPHAPLNLRRPEITQILGERRYETTHQAVRRKLFTGLKFHPLPKIEHFVHPDLELDGKVLPDAMTQLENWLLGRGSDLGDEKMLVLVADGGTGKTTLARHLTEKIRGSAKLSIPLLIESAQWNRSVSSDIDLDAIWDISVQHNIEKSRQITGDMRVFDVVVREGIFLIIFDGFDELCVDPRFRLEPSTLIDQLQDKESQNNKLPEWGYRRGCIS